MTNRIMGDVTHKNVQALAAIAKTLQLVGLYSTGTADIKATPADAALFAPLPIVWIDQAYGDTPAADAHAIVFDTEPGAFAPGQLPAVLDANTTPRPTPYCDRAEFVVCCQEAAKSKTWKGDIWLADPGWDGKLSSLPSFPGARIVAVQNTSPGAYDLSTVLDPYWPEEAPLLLPVKSLPPIPADIKGNAATLAITGSNGGLYVANWDHTKSAWDLNPWPIGPTGA